MRCNRVLRSLSLHSRTPECSAQSVPAARGKFLCGVTSVMATRKGSRKIRFCPSTGLGKRRHVFLVAAFRLAAFLAIMLFFFFAIPSAVSTRTILRRHGSASWPSCSYFSSALALQLRLIIAAEVPQVRAAEAVVETVRCSCFSFGLLYTSMATTDPLAFTEP